MNSGSEKKLSMDDVGEEPSCTDSADHISAGQYRARRNPPGTEQTPTSEVHPRKKTGESDLYTLGYHAETDRLSEEGQRTAGAVPDPDTQVDEFAEC